MRRELVFVYNADSSAWSKLLDAGHKLISPSTYACKLCALTYGAVSMRAPWSRFVDQLPHHVRFAYRDELGRDGTDVPAAPALLERDGQRWAALLDRDAIEACANLDELIARVREVT
ncbi:MAG: hypothetical protein H0X17_09820 [Deltaproteobacteria bacterium]|nr:hypothetical protein [Deltaproteobacteria bacterium]